METEFMNRITGLVIALVVGGLLVGGLLAPTVAGIQDNVGEKITLTNDTTIVLREAEDGDILRCERIIDDSQTIDVWTLNGELATGPTGAEDAQNVGIMSDGLYLYVGVASNASIANYIDIANNSGNNYLSGATAGVGNAYTFTFSEGSIIVANEKTNTEILSVPYTWAYVLCPYDEGEYCAPVTNGSGMIKDPNQVILCGRYSTGDLDTTYCYKSGVGFVGMADYTIKVNITTALHSGTTDIYDAQVSVDISDGENTENFVPFRILVPYEVQGHETAGPYYVMFGVLTLLAIVMLVVVAANGIRNKY